MSPAGTSQSEDQLYMDKLKQLSKYIEPLRRMINKIDKNEGTGDFSFFLYLCCFHLSVELMFVTYFSDRKKDLSKMKSLLNILTDPNTR